jgi:uncharacterized protein
MNELPLLCGAGFLAGSMNAIAGGGSFVAFPALVLAGLPSVEANASCAVALLPGSLASLHVYRRGLSRSDAVVPGVRLPAMLLVSLAGGVAGAGLLLATPQARFDAVIPWLLLLATLAFAFGQPLGAALRQGARAGPVPVLAVQFVLAIYGGYFGGAVGIMMMAVWSLLSGADLKAMNPAKTLLVAAANTVAVVWFVAAGAVAWPETLAVLVPAALGGYLGARAALHLRPGHLRAGVTLVAAAMTAAFFLRAW